ncbi:MAG: methyl-accepting chemotaxis protein [Candidatus Omnitrophica bacterium]|nr:methyl-accepting chemotaxis protein [Candidatus Omnitrophota bacterium]
MDKPIPGTYTRRRIYFIEKSFQAKFILKFCALVVLGGLLTIGLLYFLAMQSATVSFVNSRVVVRSTADFILPILIQTVAIVVVIVGFATVIVTLFVSHKIAGPLYRLKKVMQELEGGDFSQDFHIRHLDQLQDLAKTFNTTIKKIRERIQILKEGLEILEKGINSISENEISENKRTLLFELKKVSEELSRASRYFKTV